MKIIAALLLLASTAVHAQKFDAQDVRKTFVADCSMRGISKGDDPEKAAKFCACSFEALSTSMTVAVYLEVDRVGKAGGKPESLPQMQRVLPKIGAQCVSR